MCNHRVEVTIIGSGNVAEAFARAIAACPTMCLKQIFARNEARGRTIAEQCATQWCDKPEELASSDIYIISVSDRAVGELASQLSFAPGSIVTHTAGSVPLTELPSNDTHRGILYAFQSFTAGREIEFRGLPLFIEAESEEVYNVLEAFGQALGCRVERATSERRKVIHLAGVFVNNFVNHLYSMAGEVISEAELSFDTLRPLIMETALKALDSGNPRSVQTGPAVRGDSVVIERHLEMLGDDSLKAQIYKLLSDSIWETSKKI